LIPINFEVGNNYRKIVNPTKSSDGSVNQHGWTCFVKLEKDFIKYSAYIIKSINFKFDLKKETYQKQVKSKGLKENKLAYEMHFAGPLIDSIDISLEF
jgi:hypothetical protein